VLRLAIQYIESLSRCLNGGGGGGGGGHHQGVVVDFGAVVRAEMETKNTYKHRAELMLFNEVGIRYFLLFYHCIMSCSINPRNCRASRRDGGVPFPSENSGQKCGKRRRRNPAILINFLIKIISFWPFSGWKMLIITKYLHSCW